MQYPEDSRERIITGIVVVNDNINEVWKAWTTEDGIKGFFAPGCKIEPKPFGSFEIYFMPDAEPGMRGADGMMYLALQPNEMLSFTWNAPPSLPNVRGQFTSVTIRFHELDEEHTEVRLYHSGWGLGGEWDLAFEYFDKAWNQIVMPRLKWYFKNGPVDWENPPTDYDQELDGKIRKEG